MIKRIFNTQFMTFACVGGVGFVVDCAVFYALSFCTSSVHVARIVAFSVACLATWWLNAQFTFRKNDKSVSTKTLPTYYLAQSIGMLINFVTFSMLLLILGADKISTFIAFVLGSVVAMFFNFFSIKYFAFKQKPMEK